jgi:hypothetical protein
MDREELLDLLLEIQHDLGKYIQLPIVMLPKSASDAELREGLERALRRTRLVGEEAVPARKIWADFESELTGTGHDARLEVIRGIVMKAIGWESKLDTDEEIERVALERDLRAVGEAFREWVEELRGG